MNRMFLPASAIAMLTCSAFVTPLHAEPSVVGLWEQSDDNGRVQSWFIFSEKNGVYAGAIAKGFPAPGEKTEEFCTKCPGEQKDAPFIGLVIIDGMQRKGLAYENGTILDPRDGQVYNALMQLSPDGQKLTVRGYLGVALFGKSQVWRRLPDNALQSTTGSVPNKRPSGAATKPE
jgi:Uncharacterized protein conserved in bacteria (DUF2147)